MSLCLAACGESPKEERTEEMESLTPEEKTIQAAAKPFLDAVVAGDYPAAYAQLSSHAKVRMSLSQFIQPTDEATHVANQKKAVLNASAQDFQAFVAKAAAEYGASANVISSDQIELDPDMLRGTGDVIESAFSIGLIPETVPAQIRKGAVRAQIGVKLAPGKLKQIADQEGVAVEELEKREDFAPYCNLKVVLVEEGGVLKVGYFEFTYPALNVGLRKVFTSSAT